LEVYDRVFHFAAGFSLRILWSACGNCGTVRRNRHHVPGIPVTGTDGGTEIALWKNQEPETVQEVMPDSHFSSGIDYYCYF